MKSGAVRAASTRHHFHDILRSAPEWCARFSGTWPACRKDGSLTELAPVTYTAVCERVGRWWEITVPELDEVTQARSLDEVPATVADLVALMTDADAAEVRVKVKVEASSGPAAGADKTGLMAIGMAAGIVVVRAIARVLRRVPTR